MSDVPQRLLIVGSPCQSEIKLTLKPGRRSRKQALQRLFRRFALLQLMQMVNDKFPSPAAYGFEKVHEPSGIGAHQQGKIYVIFNDRHFPQIFGDLTAPQTLRVYRRLLVRSEIANIIATER